MIFPENRYPNADHALDDGSNMPQIWMTYPELAILLECDGYEARNRAVEQNLDRKKSRDGHTRVKLNLPLASLFITLACDEVLRTRAACITAVSSQACPRT
jgi:hypothetical protein